jgi:hypothetical protein
MGMNHRRRVLGQQIINFNAATLIPDLGVSTAKSGL